MKVPTVHMNGTSAEELTRQYLDAVAALDAAIVGMTRAYPNGRDYYTQGPKAFSEAAAEFMDRAKRVDAVRREFIDIADAIHDQVTERSRR